MTERDENAVLARITLITSLGDFISLFAVLSLIEQTSGSLLLASYSVPIKSLGIAMGGLALPRVLSNLPARTAIILSQVFSFLLLAALTAMAFGKPNPIVVLGILFSETFLKQIFEGARETYSKSLGQANEQRTLQAQILSGFFGAQTVGPVLSFFLVRYLPIEVPLAIDAGSFLLSALIALTLKRDLLSERREFSVLRPLKYLRNSSELRRIFLLRSVGYWIPVGIFNYLLFSVIQKHYGLSVIHSAWIYSVIGLGSMFAATVLRDDRLEVSKKIRHVPDAKLAAWALFGLAVTRIGFLELPSLGIALIAILVGGICNGVNAVTTQSLRRKLSSAEQFPEIVGLEIVVGRLTDWLVATVFLAALASNALSYAAGVWISALCLVGLGVLHLNRGLLERG